MGSVLDPTYRLSITAERGHENPDRYHHSFYAAFLCGRFFRNEFFHVENPVYSWMEQPMFTIVLVGIILLPLVMFWWMRRRTWM